MPTLLRPLPVLAFLSAFSVPAAAQCQQWASGFHLDGIDGGVLALERVDLGAGPELYAGGTFTRVGTQMVNNIARWDGTQWHPLGVGVNGAVNAIAGYDDGTGVKLYAGGAFTQAGGTNVFYIAKWNGSAWSPVAAQGPNNAVNDLQVYDAGTGPKLYVAGAFGAVGGIQNARRVTCWNGSVWAPLGFGTNATANDLAVYDDGTGPQLYVGGTFTNLGNNSPGDTAGWYIGRWNGTVWDGTFGALNNGVRALEVLDDGGGPALHVGGVFTQVNGQPADRVAKYSGAGWSAIGFGLENSVEDFEVFDDGTGPGLYACGFFPNAGNLARYYPGLNWIAVGGGIGGGAALLAHPFAGQPALWTGGGSNAGGNVATHGVIVWDGAQYAAVLPGNGIDVQPGAPLGYDDGSGPALYVPGAFWRGAGGQRIDATATARWNGTSWSQVGQPSAVGSAMAGAPPGPLAGLYTISYGNSTTLPTAIARWDGTQWNSIATGSPVPRFSAIAYFDDGVAPAMYVAGDFGGVGGVAAPRVAKWDGTAWLNAGSLPFDDTVSLVEHDDGSGRTLYALSRFTPRVSKLVAGAWVAYSDIVAGSALEMLSFDDGSGPALWVRGFMNVGGMSGQKVAKIVGGVFTTVPGGSTYELDDFCVFDDGSGPAIHGISYFQTFPGNASQVFRLGAAGWTPATTRLDAQARAMHVFDDGSGGGPDLFLVGDFKSAGGVVSSGIARWESCGGTGTNYCFGDGSATPCPCGNASPLGEQRGCLNSLGTGGRLVVSGTASLANDTVAIAGSAMASSSVLYFQGTATTNGGLGTTFGDGLRCAGGSVVRLATLVNAGGASQYPSPGDPSVSVRGQVLAPGLRTYQAWYRNAAAFCTSSTFNLTNGTSVQWIP